MITEKTKVYEAVSGNEHIKDIFIAFGFENITNPVKLNTVAKIMTIEAACHMKGVNLENFLNALNSAIENK
ncbi:Domain of unknown function DUF1858 [Denitrovibrio acetiphilus DSM 12809]|uniref:DUF1858 domain-containing protein n=1 Tax=Denitrovibrio acetiphilus (strain DSM 12809 / NBRC 114555 / N2460) TaxID=522772 RepID=D4H2F4_DENA2|nr:DUF1858 domain-containing protein [Denitrovibrio acetiphilus]ADD68945.1 Domain of unknown function DUF1858 [Denitrovibrio acetiphilus DSM 12809]